MDLSKFKKVKDLLKTLKKANPNGSVIVLNENVKNEGNFIPNPATLNVDTYGYTLNGEDITIDNKFVGLPFYRESKIKANDPTSSMTINKEYKSMKKYEHINPISEFIEMLSQYDENALLMAFDGHLISEIYFNGNSTPSLKGIYGNWEYFNSDKKDFIFLRKGPKCEHTFRKSITENTQKLNEEYKIVKDDIRYFKNLIGDDENIPKNAIEKIGLEKFKKYLLGVAKSHWGLGDGKKNEFPKEQYKELITKLLNKEDIDLMEETGTMSAGSYEGNALFSGPIKKKIKKSIDEGMFKPRDIDRLEKWNQRQPEKDGVKINQFNDVGKKDGYWEEVSGVDDFVSKGFYKNDKMIGVWEQFEDGVNVYNEIYDDNGEYIRAEYFNDNKDEEVDEYTNIVTHKMTRTLSIGDGIRIRKGTNVHWYPKEECFVVIGGDYPGMIVDLNPEEFYHMSEKVITEQTDSTSTGSYETPSFLAPSYKKMRLGQKTTYGGKGGKFVKVKDKCKKFPYCSQGSIDQPLEMTNTYNGESVELTPTYPKKYNPLKLRKESYLTEETVDLKFLDTHWKQMHNALSAIVRRIVTELPKVNDNVVKNDPDSKMGVVNYSDVKGSWSTKSLINGHSESLDALADKIKHMVNTGKSDSIKRMLEKIATGRIKSLSKPSRYNDDEFLGRGHFRWNEKAYKLSSEEIARVKEYFDL